MDANGDELHVLLLRAPGAQSDRVGQASEDLAAEIVAVAASPITIVSAIGLPEEEQPYHHDVLVHLQPGSGEIGVDVFAEGRVIEHFTMPSESVAELRAIARRIGLVVGQVAAERARRSDGALHLTGIEQARQNAADDPPA